MRDRESETIRPFCASSIGQRAKVGAWRLNDDVERAGLADDRWLIDGDGRGRRLCPRRSTRYPHRAPARTTRTKNHRTIRMRTILPSYNFSAPQQIAHEMPKCLRYLRDVSHSDTRGVVAIARRRASRAAPSSRTCPRKPGKNLQALSASRARGAEDRRPARRRRVAACARASTISCSRSPQNMARGHRAHRRAGGLRRQIHLRRPSDAMRTTPGDHQIQASAAATTFRKAIASISISILVTTTRRRTCTELNASGCAGRFHPATTTRSPALTTTACGKRQTQNRLGRLERRDADSLLADALRRVRPARARRGGSTSRATS